MKKYNFLFAPGGGFGDMVISKPILEYVAEHIGPHANIYVVGARNPDIYRAIIGPHLASQLHSISARDYSETVDYHGYICANEICKFDIETTAGWAIAFNESLAKLIPDFMARLYIGYERIKTLGPMAQLCPYQNNALANWAAKAGLNRVTMPQWSLGIDDYTYPAITAPKEIMRAHGLPERYITMNDGWEAKYHNRTTKSYNRWQEVIDAISLPVVQLGTLSNGQDYENVIQLRGKTDFLDSMQILANSALHLDIEGGLVHTATALGTKCLVLHGPTNQQFFEYPQNINLGSPACNNCWWLKPDWIESCIRPEQICMRQSPDIIVTEIGRYLKNIA